MSFGGYIAYSGMQPVTVYADPPPIIRFTDVPKQTSVINLDLNTSALTVEGTADVEVNVTQKEPEVRTITKWKIKEKVVEKPVVWDKRPYPDDIKPFVRQSVIPIPEVSTTIR
jgi:hypothetical protein